MIRIRRAAMVASVASILVLIISGCGTRGVSGNTYQTAGGDTIAFEAGGKAMERNGGRQ